MLEIHHGLEGHPHEEPQPLTLGLRDRLDFRVVQDDMRAGAGGRVRAAPAKSEIAARRQIGIRSPFTDKKAPSRLGDEAHIHGIAVGHTTGQEKVESRGEGTSMWMIAFRDRKSRAVPEGQIMRAKARHSSNWATFLAAVGVFGLNRGGA